MKSYVLYRHFDRQGKLLYVGITCDPSRRLSQYQRARWFAALRAVSLEKCKTKEEALEQEARAIRLEHPLYNIRRANIKVRGQYFSLFPHLSGKERNLIREYFARHGKKGGQSRSPAKVKASRANALKATKAAAKNRREAQL